MFPKSQPDLMGYDPDQVDALLARIKIQFEAAGRSLITSSIVSVARFDLVAGGYQIMAVDNTLARLGDSLEAREIAERMLRFGKLPILTELNRLLPEIAQVLGQKPNESFSGQRNGYSKSQVAELLNSIRVNRGKLVSPLPLEVRTWSLGSARSGVSRSEVDAFCDLVASAGHRQIALG
jgi:DivIVA domain-containing protein|tara:strand:- start:629 stop:1165 length:537 start_codon:yes stop_codon:yes gene_type:complete